MTWREDAANAARRFIGTPFRHQGRLPGVGLDCLGVVVCSYREIGIEVGDWPFYRVNPDPERLFEGLARSFDECTATFVLQPGDVLRLELVKGGGGKHLAVVVSGDMVVHVQGRHGKVRSQPIEEIRALVLDTWELKEDLWPH